MAAPAPPVESLPVVSPVFPAVLSLEVVPLAVVAPGPAFSANLAFSSSLAFTAFYFSRSFCFLASVALVDEAVGFISLDGPLSPPSPVGPIDVPSLSSPLTSAAAFFSASFKAYLSRSVILGYLVGETVVFFSSLDVSTDEVEDLVDEMILDLLALIS